jgi:hypothetical protein
MGSDLQGCLAKQIGHSMVGFHGQRVAGALSFQQCSNSLLRVCVSEESLLKW